VRRRGSATKQMAFLRRLPDQLSVDHKTFFVRFGRLNPRPVARNEIEIRAIVSVEDLLKRHFLVVIRRCFLHDEMQAFAILFDHIHIVAYLEIIKILEDTCESETIVDVARDRCAATLARYGAKFVPRDIGKIASPPVPREGQCVAQCSSRVQAR
jgi:hypothetical protein